MFIIYKKETKMVFRTDNFSQQNENGRGVILSQEVM